MLLMLKDTPVLQADFGNLIFEQLEPDLLPVNLKDKLGRKAPAIHENGITIPLSIPESNNYYLQEFLAGRVLPLTRTNAKKIYNILGASQSQSMTNKLRISLMCRAVSLLDNYWVKNDTDTCSWKDVSIRDNPLNEVFTQIALRGVSVSLQGEIHTPEITTNGAYAKAWKRENDGLWLYKKGHNGNFEAKVEVMVSNILDNMNVSHVTYKAAEDQDEYCCKCPCITTEEISLVDAETVEAWFNRREKTFMSYVQKNYADDLYKMWIVDYLISNPDRHSQNWGFLFEADTTRIIGLHPLFDHNNAFDVQYMQNPDADYIANSQFTMREAAQYARKRVEIHYYDDFTREDFLTERQYQSFMSRLKELRIFKSSKSSTYSS